MATSRWYTPSKTVLLTGAGFTKTFGGYLAKEMWAEILNQPEIQRCPQLREKLLENLNFESVYDEVQESNEFENDEKNALTAAIFDAYEGMDSILGWPSRGASARAYSVCRDFIGRFGRPLENRSRGFVFTLNQDLFIERFYRQEPETLRIAGVHHPDWFCRLPPDLEAVHEIVLPGADEVQKFKEQFWDKSGGMCSFVYIKLHGSFCWWSQDGSQVLAIGVDKEGKIKEPLLLWYRELFQEVVSQKGMTLVTIGYSFRDKYINNIIADAINSGLRLVVVSPELPDIFRDRLQSVHGINLEQCYRGAEIWKGVCGYWCNEVTDFCDPSHAQPLPPRGQAFFKSLGLL